MNFDLSAEQLSLMESVKKFVDGRVEPQMASIEKSNTIPRELLDEAAAMGLFGISIPEEYGGSGLSHLSRVLVHQMIGRIGFASSLGAHTGIGSDSLVAVGNEQQKRRYLPRMASGELHAAMAITEPDASSDASAMKMTAAKRGDRYYLNGVKHFITGLPRAGLISVVARTGGPGASGLSVFLVEPSFPGFRVGAMWDTMGSCGAPVAELVFQDCEVPEENRLGAEGSGWLSVTRTLSGSRSLIAGRCVGSCERLLEISTEYARNRKQFGQAIGEFQAIQFMLADMKTRTEAARWLAYHAATLADEGRASMETVAMAKLFASEALAFAADSAVQIQGGAGYISGNAVERYYRDARAVRIYEGTPEIQRRIIGRALLREPGSK